MEEKTEPKKKGFFSRIKDAASGGLMSMFKNPAIAGKTINFIVDAFTKNFDKLKCDYCTVYLSNRQSTATLGNYGTWNFDKNELLKFGSFMDGMLSFNSIKDMVGMEEGENEFALVFYREPENVDLIIEVFKFEGRELQNPESVRKEFLRKLMLDAANDAGENEGEVMEIIEGMQDAAENHIED